MSKKFIALIALLVLLTGYGGFRAAGAHAHHAAASRIAPNVESAKEQSKPTPLPDPTPSPSPTLAPTPVPVPPPPGRCLPDSMCWIQAYGSDNRPTLGWSCMVRLVGRTLSRPMGPVAN